jgi:pilus assembly protein CpaC
MNNRDRRQAVEECGRHVDRTTPRWARCRSLLVSAAAGLSWSLAAAALAVSTPAQAQKLVQFAAAKRTSAVSIAIGKSEDLRTDASFLDIAVGDPDIADVNPLTDRSLSILGKKIGTTRVSVYGEGKRLAGVFDVEVSYDTSMLARELAQRFPAAKFRVSSVNGRIMLAGTAPDGIVLDQALQIAKQFGPEVINTVQVAAPQQVMLEVRFIEAVRSAGRDLGIQWNMFSKSGRFLGNVGNRVANEKLPVTNGQAGAFNQPWAETPETNGGLNIIKSALTISPFVSAGVLSGTAPFGFLIGKLLGLGLEADILVNALEERGLARRLAEPNLVALSGDTANFLAGGEYPIPVPGAFGQYSIDYKQYGVSLAFTPTVLSAGQINLKIVPEVSQLDPANSVAVGPGVTVPGLTVRRANTTIELRDGQSFVLAGLLQNDSETMQEQLPWIGDVPVLGALFSSKAYRKRETDLVIIVTPRLVRPTRPGDVVRTPLDNTLPANDIDFFLNGKPELDRGPTQRAENGVRPFSGHVLDLPKGGINVAMQ